jgi:hypothetical protein
MPEVSKVSVFCESAKVSSMLRCLTSAVKIGAQQGVTKSVSPPTAKLWGRESARWRQDVGRTAGNIQRCAPRVM